MLYVKGPSVLELLVKLEEQLFFLFLPNEFLFLANALSKNFLSVKNHEVGVTVDFKCLKTYPWITG